MLNSIPQDLTRKIWGPLTPINLCQKRYYNKYSLDTPQEAVGTEGPEVLVKTQISMFQARVSHAVGLQWHKRYIPNKFRGDA